MAYTAPYTTEIFSLPYTYIYFDITTNHSQPSNMPTRYSSPVAPPTNAEADFFLQTPIPTFPADICASCCRAISNAELRFQVLYKHLVPGLCVRPHLRMHIACLIFDPAALKFGTVPNRDRGAVVPSGFYKFTDPRVQVKGLAQYPQVLDLFQKYTQRQQHLQHFNAKSSGDVETYVEIGAAALQLRRDYKTVFNWCRSGEIDHDLSVFTGIIAIDMNMARHYDAIQRGVEEIRHAVKIPNAAGNVAIEKSVSISMRKRAAPAEEPRNVPRTVGRPRKIQRTGISPPEYKPYGRLQLSR